MKKDIEIKLNQIRAEKLVQLPEFIAEYILLNQERMSLNTQIAYMKDYIIFLEYLLETPVFKDKYQSINQFQVEDMAEKLNKEDEHTNVPQNDKVQRTAVVDEKCIVKFLEHLNYYEKTFIGKDGKEKKQVFKNTRQGKARKLASLHSLYKYLSRKYDLKDPTRYVEVVVKKKRKIKERLTDAEINRFVDIIINDVNIESERKLKFHQQVKYRDLTMLLLLAFTGIRIAELVQLDINDIDTKEGVMIVTRKGENQERLFIPEEIMPIVKDYIEKRKADLDVGLDSKDVLFLSNQKKRIHPKTVRYMIQKYAKRANITVKVTPHTFRRTFATKLLDLHGNIQLVAQLLGHSSIETTRMYADVKERTLRETMKGFRYK